MRHESFSSVVVLNTRNIGMRLSLVNNVSGNHTQAVWALDDSQRTL
jgi:hypothetical protein